MPDEQIIIEVVVDNSAAEKNIRDQTKAVDQLTEANRNLQKENRELSKDFDSNSETIADNNVTIAKNRAAINDANKSRRSSIKDLNTEKGSLTALRNDLARNTRERNELNTTTEEGRRRFIELNKTIREQSDSLSEAEQAGGDFRRSVGNYGQATEEVARSIDAMSMAVSDLTKRQNALDITTKEGQQEFNNLGKEIDGYRDSISDATSGSQSFSDSLGEVAPGAQGVITGLQGMIRASLRFIATPLGVVLAAIAAAIALVSNAMNRNEDSANRVNRVVDQLASLFGFLLRALEPVGEFLIDGIVAGFELASQAADAAIGLISDGLRTLGFSEAANDVDEFSESVEEFVQGAGRLSDLEAELVAAQRTATRVTLEFQKEAEVLRQIRDDETKSFQERIDANRELGEVLNRQLQEERAIAELALSVADERIKQEGETVDALDARAAALADIADIEERVTGQRSEQLVNANSLERERTEAIKKEADEVDRIRQEELDKSAERARIRQEEADRIAKTERDAAFELDVFKRKIAAEELESAQERADALISIEQDKLAKLLENDELTASQRLLIEAESLKTQQDLQKQADDARVEEEEQTGSEIQAQEEATSNARVAIADTTLGALSAITKDNAVAQKAISLTQAGINIAQGVTAALASAPPPINIALAGVTAAAGAVQLAGIAGATFERGGLNADYSRGGIGKGPSHANGGIQMFSRGGRHTGEFQGGEAIITARATEMFKPQLSAMNVAGGGKSFQDGGVNLASSSTANIDNIISRELSNTGGNNLSGDIQVSVTDINRTQERVSVRQVRSSI